MDKNLSMISFFFHTGHSITSRVRGAQTAEYIGAKMNPKNGFKDDVCIWVKSQPPENCPRFSYVDIMEDHRLVPWLAAHPKVGIIAVSKHIKEYLENKLTRNDIQLIPHNHCNYERELRSRTDVKTVGFIGFPQYSFRHPLDDIRKRLAKVGLDFVQKTTFNHRNGVNWFYKNVDIQIVWRPDADKFLNPLKLSNAGSFGIPTVAYPEESFVSEYDGCFIPATSIDELIIKVKELKDNPDLYRTLAKKVLTRAENYHIEHIAKLYKKLDKKIKNKYEVI